MNSAEEILNHFNNKIKLSEFIGKYVELKPRGNSFVGKCPFHNEKTPSFSVSNEKGLFYCFGCGVGGNVFTFISKYMNFSFRESLIFTCDFLGVKLDKEKISQNFKLRKKKLQILKLFNEFFVYNLSASLKARKYLASRKISEDLIDNFSIGFCSSNQDELVSYLKKNDFNNDDLIESGLLIKSQKNQSFFPRFGERITFPIFNFANEVVGFGGRTIVNSKIKYINSPEDIIFKKSENLYGLKQNIENIKVKKEIILVEGYLDVISLNSCKLNTSVASLGTAVSEVQLKKMWDININPKICFDGDKAGINAMYNLADKALKILKPGKSINFIFLPENEDPDNFIRSKGLDAFENLKEKSLNLSEFIWRKLVIENKIDTPENLALLDENIFKIVNNIENKIVSNEYLKFFKKNKNDLVWNKNKLNNFTKSKGINIVNTIPKHFENKTINEMIIIAFLVFDYEISESFIEDIDLLNFKDEKLAKYKKIVLEKIIGNSSTINLKDILKEHLVNNSSLAFFDELKKVKSSHFEKLNSLQKESLLKDVMLNLKLPDLVNEKEVLKRKIVENTDPLSNKELLKKYQKINNEINNIKTKEIF